MTNNDLMLTGCTPIPLAHYLKALGILRLVSEQADYAARGYWQGDVFHLVSKLEKDALFSFFLWDYRPTPVVAPWNGGSGFNLRDNQNAITAIQESNSSRLESFRLTISKAFSIKQRCNVDEKLNKEKKDQFLNLCRSLLQDDVIRWLDAAFVLTDDGTKYPPLLGTGGNDGRLDFTNNFMQRICDVIDPNDGCPRSSSDKWLKGSLFSTPHDGLMTAIAIGQFMPGAAGGANAESGFNADSLVNPWDYILMIEGALFFSAASVKRLETSERGALSYPFSVHPSGVGYGSASLADEETSRAEMWLPIWNRAISSVELGMLMSEGRAQVSRRSAHNGVDFARAVATLGVDRGISSFQRYGFQVRNGLSYFATPLGRFEVRRQPQVNLLIDFDQWLDSFRSRATSEKAPGSIARALRRLEDSILALCKERGPRKVQEVLVALGMCESALSRSSKWARNSFIRPIPTLTPSWLQNADDGSPEFRLATSLASVYGRYRDKDGRHVIKSIRANMEPVLTWPKEGHLNVSWNDQNEGDVVWSNGSPVNAMIAVLSRRIIMAVQSGATSYSDRAMINTDIGDITDFLEGRINVQRMADLLWGLILIDWPSVTGSPLIKRNRVDSVFPGACYGVLKLCYPGGRVRNIDIPLVPEIHMKASAGDSYDATQLAVRRLKSCGLSITLGNIAMSSSLLQRIAAALLFPIDEYELEKIANRVLKPVTQNQ